MDEKRYFTISEFTTRLKVIFDSSKVFQNIYLKGEISNFKRHSTGHLYFSIKDEGSVINAMMWARDAEKLSFIPEDGTKVLVHGRVTVYEARGTYQIYVQDMLEDGIGELQIKFEKLKRKLMDEGLFYEVGGTYKKNPAKVKTIPKYPNKIGIVTASTGAAIRDILSTIKGRYPLCETILFPCLVQGDSAKDDIVKKIHMAENFDLDVLIVGRGGGSIEDLWAFNEEIVARAIYDCKIPVVSGVGHEPDFTIADFVADYRSPTPTGAAKDVTPITKDDLLLSLSKDKKRIYNAIKNLLSKERIRLDRYKNSYVIKNPMRMYETKMQRLDFLIDKLHSLNPSVLCEKEFVRLNNLSEKINRIMQNKLDTTRLQYKSLIEKLELVNPLSTLKRGYSITYKDGKALTDIKNIKAKDSLTIRLYNGEASVVVTNIKEM